MIPFRRAGWGLLAAVALAGCSSPPQKPGQAAGNGPPVAESPAAAAKPTEVALTVVKWPELEKTIASHKGQVVVLDVWGEF